MVLLAEAAEVSAPSRTANVPASALLDAATDGGALPPSGEKASFARVLART